MENKRHLTQVESLRAFAALAVAIFHFSQHFEWNESTAFAFSRGAQGVEIFYMISGFIIPYSLYKASYKIRDYFKYISKRLIRLLPPYFVTIILIHLVLFVLSKYMWGTPYDVNFRQTAINMLFLADAFPNYDWLNPIFATLEVELQFYILIGILFVFFKKYRWSFLVVSILLLIGGRLTYDMDTVLNNSPYFICGISIFFIKEEGWHNPFNFLPLFFSLVILFQSYYWEDLGAGLIGASLLLFLPRSFRFLSFTGRISYSYYLIHGLVGGWFLYFATQKAFVAENPLLFIPIALLISWIAAFLMYWFIERPSMKISKRIKYGNKLFK